MAARAGLLRARAVSGGGGHRVSFLSGRYRSRGVVGRTSSSCAAGGVTQGARERLSRFVGGRPLTARLSSATTSGGGENGPSGGSHTAEDDGGSEGGSERPSKSRTQEAIPLREPTDDEAHYFVDLRMDKRDSLFPEGLAGARQGEVAAYLRRGAGRKLQQPPEGKMVHRDDMPSPLLLMNRDPAHAVNQALDAFAHGKRWGENWLGDERGRVAPTVPAQKSAGFLSEFDRYDDDDDDTSALAGFRVDHQDSNDDKLQASGNGLEDFLGRDEPGGEDAQDVVNSEEEENMPIREMFKDLDDSDGSDSETKSSKPSFLDFDIGDEFSSEEKRLGETVPRRARRWRTHRNARKWRAALDLAESKRKGITPNLRVRMHSEQRSFLLTGMRGTGKSCQLNQIVLHARTSGWIVLFMPDAWDLLNRGIYCWPSPVYKGMYDLPKHSQKMLRALQTAHGDQLKKITIKDPVVQDRHTGCENLLELIESGVDEESKVGTIHFDLVNELLATKEAKVLVAIDSYNQLFQPSMWHFQEEKLESPQLTAIKPFLPEMEVTRNGYAFREGVLEQDEDEDELVKEIKQEKPWAVTWKEGAKCLPTPPANGLVVCALSGRYPPMRKYAKKRWNNFEEIAGNRIDGVSIPVEPWSRRDMERLLDHFVAEKIIPEPLDAGAVARVHAKSDGFPEKVYKTCANFYYA